MSYVDTRATHQGMFDDAQALRMKSRELRHDCRNTRTVIERVIPRICLGSVEESGTARNKSRPSTP